MQRFGGRSARKTRSICSLYSKCILAKKKGLKKNGNGWFSCSRNKSMSFTLYTNLQYHSYKVTYILSICGIFVFLSNPIIFQKGHRNTLLEEEQRHVP